MFFLDMVTLVSFWSILEDGMVNFGLIEFKLGLYIKVNANAEVRIQQIGQNGHHLALTEVVFTKNSRNQLVPGTN